MSPCHDEKLTPSTVSTEYCIHRVLYTLSTAYTAYCIIQRSTVSRPQPVSQLSVARVVLNSPHSHNYELTNEKSLSFHRTCLLIYRLQVHCLQIDRPQINHLQINRLQVLLQSWPIMASKYPSDLDRSRPPSASQSSLDLGLQIHLETRSITASKCISELTGSRPPSAFPNSHNHGLQVHHWVHPISVTVKSPIWLDHGLRVPLWVYSILASKCISKLAWSRSPSASPKTPNAALQVHLQGATGVVRWYRGNKGG